MHEALSPIFPKFRFPAISRFSASRLFLTTILFLTGIFTAPSAAFSDCTGVELLYRQTLAEENIFEKIALLEKVRLRCPDNFNVCYELGKTYYKLGENRSGSPDDDIWAKAGLALKDAQSMLTGITDKEKFQNAKIHARLGEICEKQENLSQAMYHYKLSTGYHLFPKVEQRLIQLEYEQIEKGLSAKEILLSFHTTRGYGVEPKVDLPIRFEYDSAELTSAVVDRERNLSGIAQTDNLGKVLSGPTFKNRRFLLIGHTDIRGSEAYNLKLSKNRAEAVKYYLVENSNISSHRIMTRGDGEMNLRFKGNSEKIHAINRRVEVVIK